MEWAAHVTAHYPSVQFVTVPQQPSIEPFYIHKAAEEFMAIHFILTFSDESRTSIWKFICRHRADKISHITWDITKVVTILCNYLDGIRIKLVSRFWH